MPEYVWFYDNKQGFEYGTVLNMSNKINACEDTLQVNELLLREEHIQGPITDLW